MVANDPPNALHSEPHLSGWAIVRSVRSIRLFRTQRQRLYARLDQGSLTFASSPTTAPTLSAAVPAFTLKVKRAHLVLRAPGLKIIISPELPNLLSLWATALSAYIKRTFSHSYALQDELGSGSFADVFRATHIPTGIAVAVKRIPTFTKRAQSSMQLSMELRCMTALHHPGLMSARDVFNEKKHIFIVMDLMSGGSLKEVVCAQASFGAQEIHAAGIALQTLRALAYLHARGIAHRDVKLENILCPDNSLPARGIRLGDFGFAINVRETPPHRRNFPVGTPVYVAPESARHEVHSEPVDIFAVGVMIWRMLTREYPFEGKDDRATIRLVATAKNPVFSHVVFGDVSAACMRFLKATLQTDPRKRLSANGALVHPWLAQARVEEEAEKALADVNYGFGKEQCEKSNPRERWQCAICAVTFVVRLRNWTLSERSPSAVTRTIEAFRRLSLDAPMTALSDASRRTGARIGASMRRRKDLRGGGSAVDFRMPPAVNRDVRNAGGGANPSLPQEGIS